MDSDERSNVVSLCHAADVVPLMTGFAEAGVRCVDIFSHCLNPLVYADAQLVAAVSAIARRSRQSQIRVLVRDPTPLYGSAQPLVTLIQRLPSRAQIRAYTEGAKDRYMGFFCVDKQHLVYFSDEQQWQGFAREDAPAESRHILNEFEHLWLYGSVEDPNFRTLTL